MIYQMLLIYSIIGVAVIMDYKYFKIPNRLNLLGLIAVVLFNVIFREYNDWLFAMAGFAIPFGMLYPVYKIGGIGAGDVKLVSVLGGVMGLNGSFVFTVFCFLTAGITGILKIVFLLVFEKKKKTQMTKIHFSYAILIASIIEPIVNYTVGIHEGGFF